MATAAQVLGKFAAELEFSAIPAAVIERAKDCIIDTSAAAFFGARFPWSKMVAQYAQRYGAGGPCQILGTEFRVHAPYAGLANGVAAHAFEQDSTRDPSVGAHGGATLLPAVLAMCEETGVSGESAVVAYVAGCEVLFRLAIASHDSGVPPEELGFHVPGLTSPYGAAVAAGRVLRLDAAQMTNALGIAGSLSSGLLAFTKSKQGGMVKRLHLGRAVESGILAARLAKSGYTGPETVLEGKFGFLDAYCRDADPALLAADLHKNWETLRIGMKHYPFHMTSQTPVQALQDMMAEHGFRGGDVESMVVEGNHKLLSHNNISEPGDLMQAQYSVPFCMALALFRDPEDPKSFDESAVNDSAIRAACRKIQLRELKDGKTFKTTRLIVHLKDGREFARKNDTYKGMPSNPLSRAELRRKLTMSVDASGNAADLLFERLASLEKQSTFSLSYPARSS